MGIPLAALSVRPPEQQPGALDQYGKALQLKSLMNAQAMAPGQQQLQQQAIEQGGQENQIRAQQISDTHATTKALQGWDGKDLNELPSLVLKHGGSSNAVFGLKKQIIDQKTAATKLDTDTLANNATKNDQLLGKLQAVTAGSDEELPQKLLQAGQDAVQSGLLDPQHAQQLQQMVQQTQDPKKLRDQLTIFEKSLMGQKEIFSQAQKERETAAQEQGLALKTKEFTEHLPGGALQGAELQQQNAWLSRPENKGKDAADFLAWKAKQSPSAITLRNMLPEGDALDQAAEKYSTTGQLPAGFGRSPQTTAAIIKRSAELHPNQVLAANSAEFKANEGSLKKLQSNFDNVNAFENTALKNLDQVAITGAKIPDLGARFANIPVRKITGDMIGTPEMAQFRTALLTAQTEAAKVLGSANASGVLSDSARHEAQEVLDGNLPFPAMMATINQLKTDFGNRHDSYAQQIADIKGRLGGGQNNQPSGGQKFTVPAGAPTATNPQNGHKIVAVGGKWVDAQTGAPI